MSSVVHFVVYTLTIKLFNQLSLGDFSDQKYIIDNLQQGYIPFTVMHVMATKINCDVCAKDNNEDETYQIKAKSRSTGGVLVFDLCHGCFMNETGTFAKVPRKWKKWSKDKGSYVSAE